MTKLDATNVAELTTQALLRGWTMGVGGGWNSGIGG
jgi:hypothetical protein